jgi:uncharacterized membrane protein YqjE
MPNPNPAPETQARGLLYSARAYLATWVEVFQTRLDLFSTELQEERQRLQEIALLAAASLMCLGFGALLVTFFIVAAFWETRYRLLVLGLLAVGYLAAGVIVGAITRRKSQTKPKMLSATIEELAKDYQHLSS